MYAGEQQGSHSDETCLEVVLTSSSLISLPGPPQLWRIHGSHVR